MWYMLQDGAEYDEYGNRKKYGSGHRRESAGSGTLPRGYDRGWFLHLFICLFIITKKKYFFKFLGYQNYETEPRPVYNYPPPSRTIDTKRKAVRIFFQIYFTKSLFILTLYTTLRVVYKFY